MKVFLIRFIFLFLIRFFIYSLAILPFCYVMIFVETSITKLFLLLGSILLIPILIILHTGLLCYLCPKVPDGSYKPFSTYFIKWFLRDLIADTVISSRLLNNMTNRIDFLRVSFYGLLGVKNISTLVLASDVLILDANRFIFGKNIFIGYDTLISGHFVKNRKLVLEKGRFGDNVQIGACSRIAQGVKIGDNSIIGFGVKISVDCVIGNNVKIYNASELDAGVVIEDNAVIGKKCLLGKNAVIGENSYIGDYSTVGSRITLRKNSKIGELSVIKREI